MTQDLVGLAGRPFTCTGKQVMMDGHHFADAADDACAFYLAMACNGLHETLPFDRGYFARALGEGA